MVQLAINGGTPVIKQPLTHYNPLGQEEKDAVMAVMETGVLSKYLGCWDEDFWGGPVVKELEAYVADLVGAKYALAVNSATSGLYAAMGAFGIGPGDEVIVPPYTMVASVTSAIVWGAIPVFADIDPDTFCISPQSIREKITPRTKAIVAVDIFGHPADYDEIMQIAKDHNLMVLEDAAQSPGVKYKGRMCGTLADAGVYSLNYHKHIHCGEGGIVFTNDETLMKKIALIRNHAEAVVRDMGFNDLPNMVGQNYRLSELHAAIALEQYKKLDPLVKKRIGHANSLRQRLANIEGLTPPYVQDNCEHAFYIFPIKYDREKMGGIDRSLFIAALNAEGVPAGGGYVKPIYLEPMYQQKIAIGKNGWPFTLGETNYDKGLCPECEKQHEKELITLEIHSQLSGKEVDLIATAFEKIAANMGELKETKQSA
ncbi:MAG: DegT/DnrJ/EryC1/StrS family aminotransferase [Rhodospirillales bacterium]|nr:DegT/DnrJ/EryC1/StrS family aminotransferase [Rhodospirillales bacterium]